MMKNSESTNAQDARVEALWKTLDTGNRDYLDLAGLKKGLQRMDHRTWRYSGEGNGAHFITSSQIRQYPPRRRPESH
jgi:hypothetical protein